jgi:hypothetical protein
MRVYVRYNVHSQSQRASGAKTRKNPNLLAALRFRAVVENTTMRCTSKDWIPAGADT